MIASTLKLPIARYRFHCRISQTLRLPDYAGSALRGAFGHALRDQSCVTGKRDCTDCSLQTQCPYPRLFKPRESPVHTGSFRGIQALPVPYVIEPPPWGKKVLHPGDTFDFHMVLMGDARQQLPLIVRSWQCALSRGLTSSQGRAELIRVDWLDGDDNNHPLCAAPPASGPLPELAEHAAILPVPDCGEYRDIHLELLSPLCIRHQKKVLRPKDITAAILLRTLLRRLSLLQYFQLGVLSDPEQTRDRISQLNALADTLTDERRLVWCQVERYSSRQKQKMALAGMTGHWLIRQLPPPLFPYLYLGQWLHAGKETAFGLGQYRIIDRPWSDINEVQIA